MKKIEQWKEIKGSNGLYQVSDQGRIKSVGRRNGKCSDKVLNGTIHPSGYIRYWMPRFKSKYSKLAHTIVAIHFLDFNPDSGLTVDHINRDKTDNKLCNLRVVTKSENQVYRGLDKRNKSGKSGVLWREKIQRWEVNVTKNRKQHYVGSFKDLKEAIKAREQKEKELYEIFT